MKDNGAIFGAFDGVVSAIGVIVGLLGVSEHSIVAGAVGLAVASSASMAAGEWLGDQARDLRRAAVMGAATLVGTLVQIAPFLALAKDPAVAVSGVLTVGVCAVIADRRRAFGESAVRSYVETFAILAVVVAATVAVALAIGATG